jgi:hypothetical protein
MINEGFPLFSQTRGRAAAGRLHLGRHAAFTFVGDGLRDALDPRMKT